MAVPFTLQVQTTWYAVVTRQLGELAFFHCTLAGDAGKAWGADTFLDEAAGGEDLLEFVFVGGYEVAVTAILAVQFAGC